MTPSSDLHSHISPSPSLLSSSSSISEATMYRITMLLVLLSATVHVAMSDTMDGKFSKLHFLSHSVTLLNILVVHQFSVSKLVLVKLLVS